MRSASVELRVSISKCQTATTEKLNRLARNEAVSLDVSGSVLKS